MYKCQVNTLNTYGKDASGELSFSQANIQNVSCDTNPIMIADHAPSTRIAASGIAVTAVTNY
jgi:hypothetical protein